MEDIYYIIGTAYTGKSTMVKLLAEKYDGIACEENYHDKLVDERLDKDKFLYSGFRVLLRDDSRTVEETLKIAEEMLRIKI